MQVKYPLGSFAEASIEMSCTIEYYAMLFDEIFKCVRITSFFILRFLIALFRVMKVLHEYVQECDEADYYEERAFVPLYRASRGKQMSLIFRFPNHGR